MRRCGILDEDYGSTACRYSRWSADLDVRSACFGGGLVTGTDAVQFTEVSGPPQAGSIAGRARRKTFRQLSRIYATSAASGVALVGKQRSESERDAEQRGHAASHLGHLRRSEGL